MMSFFLRRMAKVLSLLIRQTVRRQRFLSSRRPDPPWPSLEQLWFVGYDFYEESILPISWTHKSQRFLTALYSTPVLTPEQMQTKRSE